MKPSDIQQCLAGFKTLAVIGGPLVVRVHKALDVIYADSAKHGFFISVDFKFKRNDALYIGKGGWEGLSKTEATRAANELAKNIASCHSVMLSARAHALCSVSATLLCTAKLQSERFDKLVGKYDTEIG